MRTAVSGIPRIGPALELEWELKDYWAGRIHAERLTATAAGLRRRNGESLTAAGIDFIPSNDFSLYDQVEPVLAHLISAAHRVRSTSG